MAGKARRAAARQGELSRRKKRSQRGPSGIPSASVGSRQPNGRAGAVAVDSPPDSGSLADAAQQAEPAAVSADAPAPRPASRTATQPRGQGRVRGERPTAYNYVGSELRRIALLSTAVLGALIGLSFVI